MSNKLLAMWAFIFPLYNPHSPGLECEKIHRTLFCIFAMDKNKIRKNNEKTTKMKLTKNKNWFPYHLLLSLARIYVHRSTFVVSVCIYFTLLNFYFDLLLFYMFFFLLAPRALNKRDPCTHIFLTTRIHTAHSHRSAYMDQFYCFQIVFLP